MGNMPRKGYHEVPNWFLRKQRKRKESVPRLTLMNTMINVERNREYSLFLNGGNVSAFLLENPVFLDDFVKDHVDLNVLKKWESLKTKDGEGLPSEEIFHDTEGLSSDVTTKLYQMETLRSYFYFPRRGDPEEVQRLLKHFDTVDAKLPPDIENHLFPFTEVAIEEINPIMIYLLESLFGRHAFSRHSVANFLADVQASYMNTEYHNYYHALCHAQTMYWILKTCPSGFSDVEKKTLMIASICHDIGHPGCNEEFLLSVFHQLWYTPPVLESHHSQSCYALLMLHESNVFHDLSNEDFAQAVVDIRNCIISTFINRYPEQLKHVSSLIEKGFDFDDKDCRNAAKCLLMMVSDLSASWKTWKVHVSSTYCLYQEFYNQGKKMKGLGITTPEAMMEENIEKVPHYQIAFLEKMAVPMFEEAAKIFPCLTNAVESTWVNIRRWIVDIN